MGMIAKLREEEIKIKNHPESSKRYLLISTGSAWGLPCIEKAYEVEYKGLPGKLNVVLSWLYTRPQNTHQYD